MSPAAIEATTARHTVLPLASTVARAVPAAQVPPSRRWKTVSSTASVASAVEAPPVRPVPAITAVISPPALASVWHCTVPSSAIVRMLLPTGHACHTRDCTALVFTLTPTAPDDPPPSRPKPEATLSITS